MSFTLRTAAVLIDKGYKANTCMVVEQMRS